MQLTEIVRRIRIEQSSTGGDAVRRDLQATAVAQEQMGAAVNAAATVTESASRRQLSAATAYRRLQEQVDQAARSATSFERAMGTIGRASAQGVASGADLARTLSLVESRYGAAAAEARAFEEATRRAAAAQKAGWQEVGSQGARQLQNIDASRRLGSLGAPAGATPAANENRRLRSDQVQNLIYQGSDIVSSLGSGMNPGTVLLQQGGQIGQVFAGPGGASIKGAFSQASEAAAGLASRVGLVGGALAVVTTAAVAAVAAQQSYSSTQTALAQQLSGIGRAAGVTAGQINALAPAAAATGGVSVRSAREMAGEFAATGKIGAEMYGSLIGSVKDYAATTGQTVPDATKALAEAFSDPVKGAETLNRSLGFLSASTKENIERLAAQGDRLGAQRALMDAYAGSLTKATELTSGWGRLTAAAGEAVSNVWDRAGKAIDKAVTGGTIDQQLASAQKRLLAAQAAAEGGIGFFSSKDVERAQADVSRLSALVEQRTRLSEQAQTAQRSLELGGIVKALLPEQQALQALQDQVTRVRSAIAQPVKFGLDEHGLAETESAFGRISRQLRSMTEDVERFGTAATAAMVRQAEFANRTVGYTPLGRSAADANRTFEEETRKRGLDPNGRSSATINADYAARLSDPNLDVKDARGLVAAREAEMRNARELEGLRRTRDLDIGTARQTASMAEAGTGGAFSRLSASVQQQVTAAAEQYGRIPAAIIAAVAEKESGGNPNIGPTRVLNSQGLPSTSAYGLGQITTGTAQDAIRGGYLPAGFDRTDPAQGAAGIGGVLSMKLDQAGGDLAKALRNYYGSRDPGANNAYAADVLRRAGQMGDASTLGQVRDQDANARALQTANDNLRVNTELYGRNGLALEAQTTANRMLSEQLARGVPLTDALRAGIESFATSSATAAQKLKLVQFGADTAFDREQLGRTAGEQSAYSRARSMVGDTSSPEAQFVIAQQQTTDNLRQIRDVGQGAFSGIITDLSHGTSVANAFSSALSRIGDKLLSMASDQLFANIFKGALGGGGLGGLGSLFKLGGDSGLPDFSFPGFASGGMIRGPGGPREDRVLARLSPGEYVVNADATSRHFDLIHAINTGRLPGYARGGLFTSPTPEVGEEGAYDVRVAA